LCSSKLQETACDLLENKSAWTTKQFLIDAVPANSRINAATEEDQGGGNNNTNNNATVPSFGSTAQYNNNTGFGSSTTTGFGQSSPSLSDIGTYEDSIICF
jgi:hypothetical protein